LPPVIKIGQWYLKDAFPGLSASKWYQKNNSAIFAAGDIGGRPKISIFLRMLNTKNDQNFEILAKRKLNIFVYCVGSTVYKKINKKK
jgi:hypothetical protein